MQESRVKIPQIASLDTAITIYYSYINIDTKEIKELFGYALSNSTVLKLKDMARKVMEEKNHMKWSSTAVNTYDAYEAWGLDIADLENRFSRLVAHRQKLNKLSPSTPANQQK